MKICFLFPGQGAQAVGMGKEIYNSYSKVRDVYDKASKLSNMDIADITFNSSIEELSKTKNTQLAILTMSLGILEILKENEIKAEYVAGLSLGEYAALSYSEVISFEDTIKIIKTRGKLMGELVPDGEWSMAAVIGLDATTVEKICMDISEGFAVPANYNCPDQIVVSGDKKGIAQLINKAKEKGAKRVLELNTGGPFHTEKLQKASVALKKELENIDFKIPKHNVIKNIDAKPYLENDNFVDILSRHVISPVRFSESIQNMINDGVDTFVEIGPGKVLTGFVRKISKDVECMNISDIASLENAITRLKG